MRRVIRQSARVLANKYLYIKDDRVYCHEKHFETWQDLISQISPIPLLAALFSYKLINDTSHTEGLQYNSGTELVLKRTLRWSSLPSCIVQESIDFLPYRHQQFFFDIHDAHVHFSGMLQADMAWQRCLADIHEVCKNVCNKQGRPLPNAFLREGIKDVETLQRRLRLARWLQETLSLLAADECLLPEAMRTERKRREQLPWDMWSLLCRLPSVCDSWFNSYFSFHESHSRLGCPYFLEGKGASHPLSQCEHYSPFWPGASETSGDYLAWEGILWLRNFLNPNPLVACMLHVYSLLSAQFRRIAIHQPHTAGFDAFIDVAHCGLTRIHHLYQTQFMQLHRMDGRPFNMLDCRFTPTKEKTKNIETYKRYVRAVRGEEPVMLGFSRLQAASNLPFREFRLRPHFIKTKDKDLPCTLHLGIRVPCRHAKTRKALETQAQALCFQEEATPCEFLFGKDAAGNEKLCPPEVFAPTFRLLTKHAGCWATLNHTSYHVGEIFSDVTSGLRAIDEALRFLNLKPGDRIGHGTALGINPTWWRKKYPRVRLSQGTMLDNYVWIWGIWHKLNIRSSVSTQKEMMEKFFGTSHAEDIFLPLGGIKQLCNEIYRLYREIYVDEKKLYMLEEKDIPNILYRAWRIRLADPLRLEKPTRCDVPWIQEEIKLINKFRNDSMAFKIFTAYHNDAYVRRKYESCIDIDTGYITDELIYMLQDYMILRLRENKISVEVMPTSNKRIMGYKTYEEHHVLRWLGIDSKNVRPSPSILLASDNPGLFSTNIYNEYAHLLIAIKNYSHGKNSCIDSFHKLIFNSPPVFSADT